MYKTYNDVLGNLKSGKTNLNSVNRQMLRYFNKRDVDKWLMFAKAKLIYNMYLDDLVVKDKSNS